MIQIRSPETPEEWRAYYELRWKILRAPWNQPRGSERDMLEQQAHHLIAFDEGKVLGVGRIHFNSSSEAQVRYMAVDPKMQGRGVGKAILADLEAYAQKNGVSSIVLNARENALQFYERTGYHIIAPVKPLFGILHWKMRKDFCMGLLAL